MVKTPAILAKQVEREMQRASNNCALYADAHCALYEGDLQHICPSTDKDRAKNLVKFAAQYGFRLRFYRKGLCAIFGKRAAPVANECGRVLAAAGMPSLMREMNSR